MGICGSSGARGAGDGGARNPAAGRRGPHGAAVGARAGGIRIQLPGGVYNNPDGPISESQLARQREEFWSTRTSGARELWDALKLACESLLQEPPDVGLAGEVLSAADLRCPTGNLAEVYDARGRLYAVPRYCYQTPANVMSTEDFLRRTQLRPHTGPRKSVPFICRISASRNNMEQDVKMEMHSDDKVASLMETLHARLSSGAEDGKPDSLNKWEGVGLPRECIMVLRRGSKLHPEACLQAVDITPNCFVQVFVVKDLPKNVIIRPKEKAGAGE